MNNNLELTDDRDFYFPWEEDAIRKGEAHPVTYVEPPLSFPITQVHRKGYGWMQEGRDDIDPAVYPRLQFNAQGELLPPVEWG